MKTYTHATWCTLPQISIKIKYSWAAIKNYRVTCILSLYIWTVVSGAIDNIAWHYYMHYAYVTYTKSQAITKSCSGKFRMPFWSTSNKIFIGKSLQSLRLIRQIDFMHLKQFSLSNFPPDEYLRESKKKISARHFVYFKSCKRKTMFFFHWHNFGKGVWQISMHFYLIFVHPRTCFYLFICVCVCFWNWRTKNVFCNADLYYIWLLNRNSRLLKKLNIYFRQIWTVWVHFFVFSILILYFRLQAIYLPVSTKDKCGK